MSELSPPQRPLSEQRPIDPGVLQRQASDPDASVWVGASAGSGKTKVLTDRVLRLMLAGAAPSRILCLTFTKAAAAEMALRVSKTLSAWATIDDGALDLALFDLNGRRPGEALRIRARQLFARVVDCPGGLKIQTIHAFCQSLLRRFPLEAGVPPQFEAMDDVAARAMVAESLGEALSAARLDPTSDLGAAVLTLSGVLGEDEFAELTGHLVAERGRLALIFDRLGGPARTLDEVFQTLGVSAGETDNGALAAACRDEAFDGAGLRAAVGVLLAGQKTDIERADILSPWLAADEAGRVAGFEAYREAFFTKAGPPRAKLTTQKASAAADALAGELERLIRLDEKLRALRTGACTAALLRLADGLLTRYQLKKERRACLDFDDLILRAIHLLSGRVPWVLYKLDGGLDHILIDEAQDTNPDQWRVVAAVADEFFAGMGLRVEPGVIRTVFAVGDEKQSIFSFQRADPAEFAAMRRHFADRAQAAQQLWRPVELSVSFRSVAAVLECVDAVFADDAAREGVVSQADQQVRHYPFRRGAGGLVEWLPPLAPPEEAAETEAWTPPTAAARAAASPSARLAGFIAQRIRGWLDGGEKLVSRDRPIRPGDILVLVRTRSRFVNELVRALKDRGVPVAGADRMVLTDNLAVLDLAATADFLLLPDDDLTLATVLKGPFIGLTEEELFNLAHHRRGRLWPALLAKAELDPAYRPAVGWLTDLLARVDFVRPYELFAGLLTRPCPADAGSGRRALLGRLGPDAQEAVDEFLAMALSFERGEAPSLQRFLGWFAASNAQVKREHEQGADQVRIMTVHGSKGLQAPIVFMPDTVGIPTRSGLVMWPEEGRAVPLYAPRRGMEATQASEARARADRRRDQEYRRLLYVALTRAEDRLYVCGWRGARKAADHCWNKLAEAALNRLGETTEVTLPDGTVLQGRRHVTPQTVPVKQESLIDKDRGDKTPLPDWARRNAPLVAPTAKPLTPSRPDADEPGLTSPLDGAPLKDAPDRDAGPLAGPRRDAARFRRGLVIHRLLQTLPDLPPAERAAAGERYLAACHDDLPATTRAAWLAETLSVLAAPEAAALFGPGSRAEVPLVGVATLGEGGERVLSGQIDRLAVTDAAVWIVDYKTNRPVPATVDDVAAIYLRQMAAYRAALTVMYPQRSIRCLLLWTDGPKLMELPPALLEQAAKGL
jgi:ATP-dependent helicase/nuclease subunit A